MPTPNPAVIAAINDDTSRHSYLERLYAIDGRHDRSHPMHGRYTGLVQDRTAYLLHCDRQGILPLTA